MPVLILQHNFYVYAGRRKNQKEQACAAEENRRPSKRHSRPITFAWILGQANRLFE